MTVGFGPFWGRTRTGVLATGGLAMQALLNHGWNAALPAEPIIPSGEC